MSECEEVRFAQDVSHDEINRRILRLLDTREVVELDLLLKELAYRKRRLKAWILMELVIGENGIK